MSNERQPLHFGPIDILLSQNKKYIVIAIPHSLVFIEKLEKWLSNCMNKWKMFKNTCTELKFKIKFYEFMCVSQFGFQ